MTGTCMCPCEFAHNNVISSPTGETPFCFCHGKNLVTRLTAVLDAANAAWNSERQENKRFLSARLLLTSKRYREKLEQPFSLIGTARPSRRLTSARL